MGLTELSAQDQYANDHDRLRDDCLLALAVGSDDLRGDKRRRKRDRGYPLASSSTLSRLEPSTPG